MITNSVLSLFVTLTKEIYNNSSKPCQKHISQQTVVSTRSSTLATWASLHLGKHSMHNLFCLMEDVYSAMSPRDRWLKRRQSPWCVADVRRRVVQVIGFIFFYVTILKNESGCKCNADVLQSSKGSAPHHYLDILVVSQSVVPCTINHHRAVWCCTV